jgi:hypothetical protein
VLSQVQKLAKQFGFDSAGAFVVGRSAACAKLAIPAASKMIPNLFIGSAAQAQWARTHDLSIVASNGFVTHVAIVDTERRSQPAPDFLASN